MLRKTLPFGSADIAGMKSHDPTKFTAGQALVYHVHDCDVPVTFFSYGPRLSKSIGSTTDTVFGEPQSAIVRDENGSLLTVALVDLRKPP